MAALPARAAHADDDATTAIARERFKEGVQYFDQKQYDKARAAFLQAYALKRHPAVLLNLAQSELRSGHEADAAKHFAQFLRESKEATDAERQAAETGLSAAKAVVAEVAVSVDDEGAQLYIDGSLEGQTPLAGPIYLSPGAHTLSAKKEGREVTLQLVAVAGQPTSATLRFKKAAAAPTGPADTARTAAAEEHPAHAEPATSSPPAEEHPAQEPATDTRRVPFLRWLTHSPPGMVTAGLTLAGIGGGIGFAIGSHRSYAAADSVAGQIRNAAKADGISAAGVCGDSARWKMTLQPGNYENACGKYQDNVDSGDQLKTFSYVSWGVAGAAAAATIVLYWVTGKEPAKSAGRGTHQHATVFAPWISPHERGLFLSAEF